MKLSFFKLTLLATFILSSVVFAFGQTEREKGIALYQKGDYEKAVASLQMITQGDKKDRKAWLYLGMSFARLKKYKEAAKAFKKADNIKLKETKKDDDDNNKDLKIVAKQKPTYTDLARQNQIEGKIKIAIEFSADGKSKYIFVFQELPYGLTESAAIAASGIEFEPATKDGKPVATIVIVEYGFEIY